MLSYVKVKIFKVKMIHFTDECIIKSTKCLVMLNLSYHVYFNTLPLFCSGIHKQDILQSKCGRTLRKSSGMLLTYLSR